MANIIGAMMDKAKSNIATGKMLDKEVTEAIIKKAVKEDPEFRRKFIACCASSGTGIAWGKADVDSYLQYGNWNMDEREIVAGKIAMSFMLKKDPEYLNKLKGE